MFLHRNWTQLAAALGIRRSTVHAKAIIDVGVVWITLQLDSAEAVTRCSPTWRGSPKQHRAAWRV